MTRHNSCKTHFYSEPSPSTNAYFYRTSGGGKTALAVLTVFSVAFLLVAFLLYPVSLPPVTFTVSVPDSTEPEVITPPNELVAYALTLINNDRQANGLENVTLSNVDSAQLHADNILEHSFFSHWDLNGYKPYMRYTIAGGRGAVAENCAWMYSSGIIDPKEALEDLEWNMMYDDADSDWGHRHNILDPFHNRVSIGVSYNNTALCLVQDFEDNYITWSTLTVSNNETIMKGTMTEPNSTIQQIAIHYDNPVPLTVEQLNNPPFQSGYALGTFAGMVLPSGWEASEGVTVTAQKWTQTGQSFELRFNLSEAFASYGEGVYTLLIWTENENHLTTYSVWYEADT